MYFANDVSVISRKLEVHPKISHCVVKKLTINNIKEKIFHHMGNF